MPRAGRRGGLQTCGWDRTPRTAAAGAAAAVPNSAVAAWRIGAAPGGDCSVATRCRPQVPPRSTATAAAAGPVAARRRTAAAAGTAGGPGASPARGTAPGRRPPRRRCRTRALLYHQNTATYLSRGKRQLQQPLLFSFSTFMACPRRCWPAPAASKIKVVDVLLALTRRLFGRSDDVIRPS